MSEQKKQKLPYFSDAILFKRVDKYLDDNIDKRMIDKDAMVDELRNTYKEYQRRNRSAFRIQVFKAYNMINQNILEVTQERPNDGSDVEALDDQPTPAITQPPRPTSAAGMMQAYLQGLNAMASPVNVRAPKGSNSELINISSDEGEEEPRVKRPATASGMQHQSYRGVPKSYQHHQHNHLLDPTGHVHAHQMRVISSTLPEIDIAQRFSQEREAEQRKRKSKKNYPSVSIYPAKKKKVSRLPDTVPEITFEDFGGYPKVLQAVRDLVLHFYQSDVYSMLGVTPPRGFILHGPPGCGKSLLAQAVAGELNLPLVKVSGPELIGGISGESEERIRRVFQQAKQQVPCILFIDEIDVVSQTRENARKDMERRIVSQLIVSLDDLSSCEEGEELIVIGATNRVDELDPGLRRAGRFDKEVCIGIPDRTARVGILRVLCRLLKLSPGVSIEKIAELTPGFVAADLKSLISDAAVAAVKRLFLARSMAAEAKRTSPKIVNEEPIKIADDDKSDDSPMVVDDTEPTKTDADSVREKSSEEPAKENGEKESPAEDESTTDEGKKTNEDEVQETDKTEATVDSQSKPAKAAETDHSHAEPAKEGDKNEGEEKQSSNESEEKQSSSEPPSDMAMEVVESSKDDPVVIEELPPAPVANGLKGDDEKSEDFDACVIVEDSNQSDRPRDSGVTIQIEMADLLAALKTTQPSAKREGFATVPDVTWDDIGSLKDVRNELTMSIMMPVKYPDEFKRMGIDAPSGIMLWGPPGCGKTLLAKAIANEANINFISVKGPELLNMYVGESEKAVRTCFERARNSQPCVIFFDEIDALCPRRSDASEGSVSSRVVNQVLTEMDGVEGRAGVFLMAASNRPDMVDPAVLRPGRLDKIVKVGLPNAQDRVDILKAITKDGKKPPLEAGVALEDIGNSADGYSGADLAALVKEASLLALTEHLTEREALEAVDRDSLPPPVVGQRHFENALKKIKPSVLAEERKRYERLERSFAAL